MLLIIIMQNILNLKLRFEENFYNMITTERDVF
jgi:hypothetical protein